MSDSIRFDGAAEYYDRTRSLAAPAMEQVMRQLVAELADRGPALEIGVGTGRFALPVNRAGIAIVGLDLSAPMLERLIANAGGAAPFPLVLGDATLLPFADASFGSAFAAHVFHLIPRWRDAIEELRRVVRPGGRLLVDIGKCGAGEWADMFRDAAELPKSHPGVNDSAEIDDYMKAQGTDVRLLDEVKNRHPISYRATIEGFERGQWSFTWPATQEARSHAAEVLRKEVARRGHDLDDEMGYEHEVQWRVYDLD